MPNWNTAALHVNTNAQACTAISLLIHSVIKLIASINRFGTALCMTLLRYTGSIRVLWSRIFIFLFVFIFINLLLRILYFILFYFEFFFFQNFSCCSSTHTPQVRRKVLAEAIPVQLQELVPGGLDTILSRLPPNYVKTLFCSHLSSNFVYKFGLNAGEFAFFEFIDQYVSDPGHSLLQWSEQHWSEWQCDGGMRWSGVGCAVVWDLPIKSNKKWMTKFGGLSFVDKMTFVKFHLPIWE